MEMKPAVQQAVRSQRDGGGAFPQQQSRAIIARMRNDHNANTHNKMRTKCRYHFPH